MAAAARKTTTSAKADAVGDGDSPQVEQAAGTEVSTTADTGRGKAPESDAPEVPKDGLGKVAYEAYAAAVGSKAHDGSELPAWDELHGDDNKRAITAGWESAAQAVLTATFGRK